MPALRRRSCTSAVAFVDAGSQDSGTNSRQATGQDAVSVTMLTDMAIWQLVTFPAVPVYWRATHGDAVPHLSSPVSSTAHACGLAASSISSAITVRTVVEIGLGYGSSALAIGEALVTIGSAQPRHIVIDPFQQQAFANVGWDLLCCAGLDSITTLLAAPSSIALPKLVTEGVVADAAFRGRQSPVPRGVRRSLLSAQDRPAGWRDCP